MKRFVSAFLVTFSIFNFLSAGEKPNIVFLLADDMNRDTWGIYGSKDCKTPNIDALATLGMKFNKAYSSVAMCAPFRQELYSGRTPWRTGTLANHSKSVADTKSIPHYLKALGYRVALTGKSHVSPQSAYPFEFLGGKANNDKFVETSTKFFDECKKENKPFCIYIASSDGHAPFTTGDPSQYDADKLTIPPYWQDTPEMREVLVKYYAEITNFDDLVGRVKKVLEDKGLWENTIFVVCSEQGVQLPFAKWTCYNNGLNTGIVMSWPGVIKPGSETDSLISIADITPTFVEAAGGDLADIDVDGKSFLKTLKGEKQSMNEYVYGAFTNCNIIDNRDRIFPIRVIRNSDYSLIYNPNSESYTSNVTLTGVVNKLYGGPTTKRDDSAPVTSWLNIMDKSPEAKAMVYKLNKRPEFEFYNLKNDPHEMRNEIANPEYKEAIDKMKKALMARLEELGDSDPIMTEKSLVKRPKQKKKKSKKNN